MAYFQKTVSLFKSLDSYQFLEKEGIVPSTNKTYIAKKIQKALGDPRMGVNATIGCSKGVFEQIFYNFNVAGSAQNGEYVPVQPPGEFKGDCSCEFGVTDDMTAGASFCPETGIKYLPKNMSSEAPTQGPY